MYILVIMLKNAQEENMICAVLLVSIFTILSEMRSIYFHFQYTKIATLMGLVFVYQS